jgi:hypothetical protein
MVSEDGERPDGSGRARIFVLLTAAAVACALLAVSAAAVVQRWPAPKPVRAASTSWCVYTSNSVAWLNTFDHLVDRQLSCAVIYNDVATTWETLMNPWFLLGDSADHRWDRWIAADGGRQLVLAQGLVPADAPADWRARGAAGDYDAQFRALGQRLVAAGLGNSIIRLAHEANGDWFFDNIGSDQTEWTQWATYWARVAAILHSTPGAHFELDLTVSSGPRAIPLASWYPGDAAVDIIGIDVHDIAPDWVGTAPAQRWTYQMTQPGGFEAIAAFAAAHRKTISVPEWGVTDQANHGAGDNSYYVQHMLALFSSYGVRYNGLWDKLGTPSELARNPKALALYRSTVDTG